jgi:hypothetical protein
MYQLQASMGWLELQDAVKKEFGEGHKYTALVPDLSGAPPCRCRRRVPVQRYQFQAAGGWLKLQNTVHKQFGSTEHPFTRLVPDLSGSVDWLAAKYR